MTVSNLEIFVEEPSVEAFLNALIPLVTPSLAFRIYPYNGQPDLLDKLPARLKGYKKWLPDDWRILILTDSDGKDCKKIKKRLESIAKECGFTTRSAFNKTGRHSRYTVINRIVVEELESWYFGDWGAVCEAFPGMNKNLIRRQKYRRPDAIGNAWEAFERVLRDNGFLRPREHMAKIATAHNIGAHIQPDKNTSRSFQCLIEVLKEVASS